MHSSLYFASPAVKLFRVITGCGSHGVGKSKLKNSVSSAQAFFPIPTSPPTLHGDLLIFKHNNINSAPILILSISEILIAKVAGM